PESQYACHKLNERTSQPVGPANGSSSSGSIRSYRERFGRLLLSRWKHAAGRTSERSAGLARLAGKSATRYRRAEPFSLRMRAVETALNGWFLVLEQAAEVSVAI